MDESLGWRFWLWVIGVALAVGIGGLLLFLLVGAAWYRWYMRRLAERPANVLFVVKSLFG